VSSLGGSKITTGLTSSLLGGLSVVSGKLVPDFEEFFASLCFGLFLIPQGQQFSRGCLKKSGYTCLIQPCVTSGFSP